MEIFPAGCFFKKQDFLPVALLLSPALRSPPLFGGRSPTRFVGRSPRPKGGGAKSKCSLEMTKEKKSDLMGR